MFSAGTTVAVGFAHSDTAGQLATICKMVEMYLLESGPCYIVFIKLEKA